MNGRAVTVLSIALLAAGCNLFRSGATSDAGTSTPPTDMGTTDVPTPDAAPTDIGRTDDGPAIEPDAGADMPEPGGDAGALPDLAWDRGVGRVTRNLLLYYTFEEGTGTEVLDRSTRGDAPSLMLGPTATWLADRNGVHIDGPERISGPEVGAEIWDWVVPREELTVEVWAKPDNLTQNGPARIVTFSANGSVRNFTIGQEATAYSARLSVNDGEFSSNGTPAIEPTGTVSLAPTHVAFTYDGLRLRLFVNGFEAGSSLRSGGLQHWDRLQPFQLGNENAAARPWAGEIYMLAVYDRALTPPEIARNFAQGSLVSP